MKRVFAFLAICAAVSILASCAAGPSAKNSGSATAEALSPRVGEVWYVIDHAYTDEVYSDIEQSGPDSYPAQTTSDAPDRSFHLARPYPCKVTDVRDDGFFKCSIDSDHTLDVQTVWTNRLLSKGQAEAIAPGTVIHKTAKARSGLPPWLRIRTGLKLYTGYDGGDSTTVTVCTTRSAYKDQSSGGVSKRCTRRKPGIPVHVVSYTNDYSLDGQSNFPVLQIAADEGAWSGYTGSLVEVQPRIPVGTTLVTEKSDTAKVKIWSRKSDPYESGTEVEDNTGLKVLKQDPTDVANSTLLVRVLSGRYTGREGWTLNSNLQTTSGEPVILSL